MMINRYDRSPIVQRLAQLGSPGAWEQLPWLKYESLGVSKKHIPDLIEVIERFDEYWDNGQGSRRAWTPMHAWRALAQLRAEEALPALARLLARLDEHDTDLIQEDLPKAFGLIGPPAAAVLLEYLLDGQHGLWVRAAAADGLRRVAEQTPAARDKAVSGLARALENYPANQPILNGFLIKYLGRLKGVEAAGLVEQAFAAGQVDGSISGDWEDYQVAVGLLKERQTPRQFQTVSPAAFRDGLTKKEEEAQRRYSQRIWLKRHKQKRKLMKESRKINQKKKKKKKA